MSLIPYPVVAAFLAAAVATPVTIGVARRFGVLDRPDGDRKRHVMPRPLLGGAAVLVGISVGIMVAELAGGLPGDHIKAKYLVGIVLACVTLMLGGALDDILDLPPRKQIVWPVLAALIVVASGIGVTYITNPLGGQVFLDEAVVTVLWWHGIPYKLTVLADLFTLGWLLTMTYTTKFLDGVDGLVSGVTVIGGFVIAAVSMTRDVSQPDTAILALVVAAAFFGFLLFNFHPARIFLGEGGSTMAGFLLGTLAIVSGGKIATTLLILGLPLFDAAIVVFRRMVIERRSPVRGDRTHLHFRLLDLGLTERQAVLAYYLVAALLGTSTLFLKSGAKAVILTVAFMLVAAAGILWATMQRRRASGPARDADTDPASDRTSSP